MARNPGADNDGVRPVIRQREKVRSLRIRPHAHAESKNQQVAGAITTGMYIPPFFIAINPDDTAPEWKYIIGLFGILNTGTCTVEWLLNGSLFWTQNLSNVGLTGVEVIDPPVELAHGDYLQATITDDSGAADMVACVVMVTSPS